MRRIAMSAALAALGLASAAKAVDVSHSFSVQVFSVDPGITLIAPGDFFEISYTINQSLTDQNGSPGGGSFPSLASDFTLAARPLNAGTWNPMGGTFNLAGSNYVTNAFGNNYTFQMLGSGFPNGGTGVAFLDLDLNWTWTAGITDSGLGDPFVTQLGGGTFNPAQAVLRNSSIRFSSGPGDIREARILPETPALAGDYNVNGVVDAADYVVWRNQPPGVGILVNDATPGIVSSTDYDVWRAHFGQTYSGAGSSLSTAGGSVPEPNTMYFGLTLLACLVPAQRTPRAGTLL